MNNKISEINISSIECFHAYFGEVVYEPGGQCGPRVQPDIQFVVVDRGSCDLTLDDRLHKLLPGRTYCLWPGGYEYFRYDAARQTAHRWLALSIKSGIGPIETLRNEVAFDVQETQWMRKILRLGLQMQAAGCDGHTPMMVQLGLSYLGGFMQHACLQSRKDRPPLPPPVSDALQYMAEHVTEPLTLNDLAAAAAVTPPHLIRLFQSHLYITPMRLLWRKRVERGSEMLRDTGLSVSQIAYQLGFSTPFHFSRLVKQHFGCSPTEWRKQQWRIEAEK